MAEHDWISAHMFYRGDADLLITTVVGPLTAELAAARLADRSFFLRYWDGGPHLRLRLIPLPGCGEEVRTRLQSRANDFFQRHPSTAPLDAGTYAAQAAELAAAEGLPDYLRHPRPADSLEFIPYRREHHRYGYGASMEAAESHFVEASRIALGLVATGMSAGFRATAALSMLLVAWLTSGATPALPRPRGQQDDPAVARADAAYDRQRERLCAIARAMHTVVRDATSAEVDDGSAHSGGAIAAWAHSVEHLRAALDRTGAPPARAVIDICAHLMCNRLGVGLHEESYLRHLAARTLIDLPLTETDVDAG